MQKFQTPAPISAILEVPAGRVRFIAADRADTTVEIRPADAASGRDKKMAEQATVEYSEGVLRIEAPAGNRILGSSGSVEVTVQLPAGSRVEAKAASADFRTVGRLGEVAFDGSHASVKIDEATRARLTTLDGEVCVGRLAGDAEIRTGKGDIRIDEAMGGTVALRTEAGTISVTAAAGVSASLDAGVTHGRIHNALKNTALKNTEGAVDLAIHATTAHGDITARSL